MMMMMKRRGEGAHGAFTGAGATPRRSGIICFECIEIYKTGRCLCVLCVCVVENHT